jgi:hypothetical protein
MRTPKPVAYAVTFLYGHASNHPLFVAALGKLEQRGLLTDFVTNGMNKILIVNQLVTRSFSVLTQIITHINTVKRLRFALPDDELPSGQCSF